MSGIKDTATVTLRVNGVQAKQMMADIETKIKNTEATIEKMKKSMADPKDIEKARKQLKTYQKQLDEMRSATEGVGRAFRSLDTATPRQLEKALRTLNRQLKDLQPGSDVWNSHIEKIRELKTRLSELGAQTAKTQSAWGKFKDWAQGAWSALDLISGWYDSLIGKMREYVDAYAEMEQETANVRKFTGMTADEVDLLNEQFRKIDTRSSREQLNKLAQEAGRLGLSSQEDVLGFVRSADKINVALDDLGDGATLTISKLTDIFGDRQRFGVEQSLLKTGSVINELSQSSSASAPYIAHFAERLSGVGNQARLTVPQIMALGAVLDSTGQKVEASSTAVSQVLVRMMQDPAKYAKVAGLEVESFAKLLREDANEAFLSFLETLNNAGGLEVLAPMFKDMGENGSRAIATLSTLANNIDLVRQRQQEASIAFQEGTSVNAEFAVQNETVQAKLEKAQKRFQELRIELGEKLYPLMIHFTSASSATTRALSVLVDYAGKYKSQIITLTVAIGLYVAALKLKEMWTSLAAAKTLLLTKVTQVMNGVLPIARLLVAALTNSIQYLTNGLKVNYAMQQRWNAAMAGMKFANWTALIIALGAAIYALYQKFTQVSAVTKALQKIQEDANASVAESVTKIKSLQSVIENNNLTLSERYAAIKQLRGIMSDYNATLDEEGRLIGHNTKLIDDYVKKLRERAIAEATQSAMADAYKDMVNAGTKIFKPMAAKGDKNGQLLMNRLLSGEMDDSYTLERTANWYNFKGQMPGVNVMSLDAFGGIDADLKENVEAFNDALSIYSALSSKVSDNFKKSLVPADRPRPQINSKFAEANKEYKAEADKIEAEHNREMVWAAKYGDREKQKKLMDKRDFLIQKLNDKYQHAIDSFNAEPDADDSGDGDGYKSVILTEKEAKRKQLEEKRDLAKAKKAYRDEMEKAKGDWEADNAANLVAYASGTKSYSDYIAEKERIDLKYINDRIKVYNGLYDNETAESKKLLLTFDEDYQELLLKKAEMEKKHADEASNRNIKDLQREYKAKTDEWTLLFNRPDSEWYGDTVAQQEKLHELKINYLAKYRDAYKQNSQEWTQYQQQIEDAEAAYILERRKSYVQKLETWRKKYSELSLDQRKEMELAVVKALLDANLISLETYNEKVERMTQAFSSAKGNAPKNPDTNPSEKQKSWYELLGVGGDMTSARRSLGEAKAELSRQLSAGEIDHEEYLKRLKELDDNYHQSLMQKFTQSLDPLGQSALNLAGTFADVFKSISENGQISFENIADIAAASFGAMAAGLEVYSQFAAAQSKIEIAAVERKYDREIEAAQGNTYKTAKLEKQKEKQVAKLKAEATKKEFNIKVAQAIANIAQSAILGYMVGWQAGFPSALWLAPALAGLATATGMIQLALIKKQQKAAEAEGYAEGGFTKPGSKYEPAGIVHAGEWVASQKLLSSPVARPLIDQLDYVQRTNTIGSLKSEDVSRAITAPQSITQIMERDASSALLVAAIGQSAAVVKRLADRLDEPIAAIATVAGDHGINQAQAEYDALLRNITPKSKRK